MYSESGWCDCALRGRSQRCGENVRKTRGGGETSKKMDVTARERERFARSKIIVTLSLDSTHYFCIQ